VVFQYSPRKVAAGFTAILVVAALFHTPASARTPAQESGPAVATGVEPEGPVTIQPFYSAENVGPTAFKAAGVAPLASSARKPPSSPDVDGGQAQQCLSTPMGR
jgi:hypothetical protein